MVAPSWTLRSAALAALLLSPLCTPALAHSAAEMGGLADQFDLGIPVLWPYHALLMAIGFVLLLAGFLVMRYRLTGGWFRNHQRLQTAGGLAVVIGLAIGIYMVQLSGVPHLGEFHGVLGAATIAVILVALGLGLAIVRSPGIGKPARRLHRWLGGIGILLVAVNIAVGLAMISAELAR